MRTTTASDEKAITVGETARLLSCAHRLAAPDERDALGRASRARQRRVRISVRTLHHYDEIGLLRPSGRTQSGYRLYALDDLSRLRQILFYRELGFSLPDIARAMHDPAIGRREALLAQRELLAHQEARTRALLATIDSELAALEKGTTMDKQEMFEVFGDFDPSKYEDEVKERWGDTDAYRESSRRAASYTKTDWQRIQAEGGRTTTALAARMTAGAAPTDTDVMDLAEEHRLQIDRNFYPCSHEMHVGLGEMYVADPRFTAFYDKIQPGLAAFLSDAIKANAERAQRGAIRARS